MTFLDPLEVQDAITIEFRRSQRTLKGSIATSGIGVHTGMAVTAKLLPAPAGSGIIFRRSDQPDSPHIVATVESVTNTARSTTIGESPISVTTIEHVLAALKANQVDNVYVDIDAAEAPVGDGSSKAFVEMIEAVGTEEQGLQAPTAVIRQPIYWSEGHTHLVALPYEKYRISCTLSYPQSPVLEAQYHTLTIDANSFNQEIAPCRTFSLYEEIEPLMNRGLIKGGSLSNAVIIKGNAVISREGLKFPNEMVRHKILDLIGDLSLIGCDLQGHIIAIRSSHTANVGLARKIRKHIMEIHHDC